jgi:hypothetical protein
VRASCLPETSRRAPVANAWGDSPVSDAPQSIPEKRDAFLSPSRFSTHETQYYAQPGAGQAGCCVTACLRLRFDFFFASQPRIDDRNPLPHNDLQFILDN